MSFSFVSIVCCFEIVPCCGLWFVFSGFVLNALEINNGEKNGETNISKDNAVLILVFLDLIRMVYPIV